MDHGRQWLLRKDAEAKHAQNVRQINEVSYPKIASWRCETDIKKQVTEPKPGPSHIPHSRSYNMALAVKEKASSLFL